MKKSATLGLLSICFACVLAVLSFTAHVFETAYVTCRAFKNLVVDKFMQTFATDEPAKASAVWFVRTKAFVARIIKRERPQVTPGWRMCPSI